MALHYKKSILLIFYIFCKAAHNKGVNKKEEGKKMRIAIIGGTFNPVTKAHIAIAKNAKEFVKADLVIFVPTKIDYIKKWKKYQNT